MKRLRRGATRTQLLVVIALGMMGMLAFAIGAPLLLFLRENSRLAQCRNNLKVYGIGIHTYHDVWNRIPSGATEKEGIGHSFQVPILPMMGQERLYDEFRFSGRATGDARENVYVAEYGDGVVLPFARCPSSSLPVFAMIDAGGKQVRHQISSYVGIAGSDNITVPGTGENSHTSFAACCNDLAEGNPQQGIMSVDGALVLNSRFGFGAVRDGLSNTLFMSEQSGWGKVTTGGVPFDASSPHGWLAGTAEVKTAEQLRRDGGKTNLKSVYNLTTIVYQPGSVDVDRPGVSAGHGPNNPLISGHSGVVALMGDGSIRQFPYRMDLIVLKKLSLRADGLPLEPQQRRK